MWLSKDGVGLHATCQRKHIYFDADLCPTLDARKAAVYSRGDMLLLLWLMILIALVMLALFVYNSNSSQRAIAKEQAPAKYTIWAGACSLPDGSPFLMRSHTKDDPHWQSRKVPLLPLKIKREGDKLYYHAVLWDGKDKGPNSSYWGWVEVPPETIPPEPPGD